MITVLFLDDGADYFASIRQHLARFCDITVHAVTPGRRVSPAMRQKKPDAIVAGAETIGPQGPVPVRKIREIYPAIPVILICARDEEEKTAGYPGGVWRLERPEKIDTRFILELAETIRIAVMGDPEIQDLDYELDLLAQIMETSTAGILVVDRDGAVTFANRAATELLGPRTPGSRDAGLLAGFPFAALIDAGSHIRDQHYTIRKGDDEQVFLLNGAPLAGPGERQQMVVVIEDVTETVHLEEDLIKSEDRYRAILEEQNELICRFLPDTTFTYVNKAYCRYNRRSADQLLGHPMITLLEKEEVHLIADHLQTILGGAPYVAYEYLHRGDGGEEQWQQWTTRGIRNDEGRVVEYQSVGRDVTAQKRTEQALRESEERYRLIADNMEDLVWMMDSDHAIHFMCPSMERALGFSYQVLQMQGVRLEECLTLRSRRLVKEAAGRGTEPVLNGAQPPIPVPLDLEFRRTDGSTFWAEVHLTTIRDDDEHPSGILGVGRDVTARRRTELALRESEERFRLLAENATDMIARHALDSTYRYVSPACIPLLGYTPTELIGRPSLEFIHPDDNEKVRQAYTDVLSIPDIHKISYRFRRRDGAYIWLETTGRAIRDPLNNNPLEVYTSSRDVTDRKRLEEAIIMQTEELRRYSTALAQANRKLSLLNSVTRHDIKNQLTVIAGYLELLQSEIADQNLLGYLHRQQHAADLIRHHIEFTKTYQDLGAEAPRWQPVAEMLATVVASLDLNGIVLDADLGGLEIFADPMLEKVFLNLIENGIRHGRTITRIRLWFEQIGTEGTLICQDDGIGIPWAEKERIFERGYGSNTGLGLFLIREILSITGIAIQENGEEGAGARFVISIPAGGFRIRRTGEEGDGRGSEV